MTFEASTVTAALPTINAEVTFGSLANTHNYFDAYVDFLANVGNQRVQLRIYATSAVGGVRSLVAQSDWLIAQLGAVPIRAIKGLQKTVGSLFELVLVSDNGVCGNIKASLVGYESLQNSIPPETNTNTVALAATETVMATISNPHSFFDASADYLACLGARVRWSLYATAGTGGVRAKVAQFDMPAAISANQKQLVLESIGPIGANLIELTSQSLDALPTSPNIKASLDGFDPINSDVSQGGLDPSQSVNTFVARSVGANVNQSLVAYDVSAANNDNVALVEGDIVLLINQTLTKDRGPWVVGVVNAGTAPLTRPSWFPVGLRIGQANYFIKVQGDGVIWPYTTFIAVAVAGRVIGTDPILVAPNAMRGTGTLAAGTATITLPGVKLGVGRLLITNTANPVALKGVFSGGNTQITVSDLAGGTDTFDWVVFNF